MKLKWTIALVIVIVIVLVILKLSNVFPPASESDTSGDIGGVKKYSSYQMTEKDVKLTNVLLKDKNQLGDAIKKIEEYKIFLTDLSKDLGTWYKKLEYTKGKTKDDVKDQELLVKNSTLYYDYKSYLDANIGVLDTLVMMLNSLKDDDTKNDNQRAEEILNSYENFRLFVSQKFLQLIESIPKVHNVLVKNKEQGIIGNHENQIGVVLYNTDFSFNQSDLYQNILSNNQSVNIIIVNKPSELGIYNKNFLNTTSGIDLKNITCIAASRVESNVNKLENQSGNLGVLLNVENGVAISNILSVATPFGSIFYLNKELIGSYEQ